MSEAKSTSTKAGGVSGWVRQIIVFTLILVVSLFVSSGRLGWVMAWIYVGVFVVSQVITGLILIPSNPELLAERAQRKDDVKDWDKVLANLVALIGPLSMWIVAGLDARAGWSPQVTLPLQIGAMVVAMLGSLLTIWAMASNKFFYGVMRVDNDAGHAVAAAGPYGFIRHPGYLGGVIFDLATPLALGTLWAFVPAVLTVGAILVRTALEDRTLQDELDGYRDYAKRVRYHLLPGIW
jgi:protein-S-isoprenylcysteine O-methyltransferase Ste14